jgi:hypothetical protein
VSQHVNAESALNPGLALGHARFSDSAGSSHMDGAESLDKNSHECPRPMRIDQGLA